MLARRTGFSREGGIYGEGNLANVPTSSRLKPVLRGAQSLCANSFAKAVSQTTHMGRL